MGAKGQPKTGGASKGSTHKKSKAKAELDAIWAQEDKPIVHAKKMLDELMAKGKLTEDELKTVLELFKMLLPYTSRRQPLAIENKDMNALEQATHAELEAQLKELEEQ